MSDTIIIIIVFIVKRDLDFLLNAYLHCCDS